MARIKGIFIEGLEDSDDCEALPPKVLRRALNEVWWRSMLV